MSGDLPVGANGIVCAAHRTISSAGHVGFTSDLHSQKQTTQRLQANCQSTADHRQIIFRTQSEIVANRNMRMVPWYALGRNVRPDLVGDDHELVVKLRRALSHRYSVNRIAV
jgi:hypothetical protein